MSEKQPTYIEFKEDRKIHFAFHSRFIVEKNGMYSWYMPAYKMFFSSKTKEEGIKRGVAMAKSFFMFWDKQNSYRGLILELHHLGFRAPQYHNLVVSEMIRKKRRFAKFNATDVTIPEAFADSSLLQQEGTFAMAS